MLSSALGDKQNKVYERNTSLNSKFCQTDQTYWQNVYSRNTGEKKQSDFVNCVLTVWSACNNGKQNKYSRKVKEALGTKWEKFTMWPLY